MLLNGIKVAILFNPVSGSGKGAALAARLQSAIEQAEGEVKLEETTKDFDYSRLANGLEDYDTLIVIGGDGTVRKVLPSTSKAAIPLYMLPAGNESLFARAFKMSEEPEAIVRSIRKRSVSSRYYGEVNGEPFFLMASIGFDADVVAKSHANRTGPLGNMGYVRPVVDILHRYQDPKLNVIVDGNLMIESKEGCLIIANSPQYARGLDPIVEADSSAYRLHGRFYPDFGRAGAIKCLWNMARRLPFPDLLSCRMNGSNFEVHDSNGVERVVQADGDVVGTLPVTIKLAANPLLILLP